MAKCSLANSILLQTAGAIKNMSVLTQVNKYLQIINKHKVVLLFLVLLVLHLFLRFYQLLPRANFGWDQVDSAWAAKKILVDKNLLLNGPVAKGNSGIYMGPLYYYLIAVFYFFTNLDPIASPIFQALLSIINFLVLFIVTKKLFGIKVAFVAGFINTFSNVVIGADRVQSIYYLIPAISYLIFYFLYKTISGYQKNILWLAVFTGLSFHVDFTSVFYPLLIVCALPFFPRNKQTIRYIFLSLPVFLLLILPILISTFVIHGGSSNGYSTLFNTFYHGLHLTRVLQISHDAFISVEQILQFGFFRTFVFLVLPIFMLVYYLEKQQKNSLKLFYLMAIWIVIPWLVLATYAGELTDYYFSLPRDFVIAILAYLSLCLWQNKIWLIKLAPVVFWAAYSFNSLQSFFKPHTGDLLTIEESVKQTIQNKKTITFKDKDPYSYIYYVYSRK